MFFSNSILIGSFKCIYAFIGRFSYGRVEGVFIAGNTTPIASVLSLSSHLLHIIRLSFVLVNLFTLFKIMRGISMQSTSHFIDVIYSLQKPQSSKDELGSYLCTYQAHTNRLIYTLFIAFEIV